MMIVMSDPCTLNVSRRVIDDYRSINYQNIMILNDTSRVVRMMPTSLTIVILMIIIV
jgi:hypothetical protein